MTTAFEAGQDPSDLTALELGDQIRRGERSATEVWDFFFHRMSAVQDAYGAFLQLYEHNRSAAEDIDRRVAAGEDPGIFAGVPVALKDNMCTNGVATTCSSKILEGWIPPYDATVVTRMVDAGAVVVGKTNLDEFAMGSSTENSAFGATRNPHDITKVPGGSSGGSAATVGAGAVPLSLGSDTGGSIRQPASLCGVVGVKPTYGAVSRYGLIAFASSLDQIGPFTSTVADAALALEVIGGHDPLDSTSIPQPMADLTGVLDRGVDGLRIGIITELSGDEAAGSVAGIAADVVAQVTKAAQVLEAAGAKVSTTSIPSSVHGLPAYYLIAPAEASSNLARYDGVRYGHRADGANALAMNAASRTAGFGEEVKRRIMLGTYALSSGYYDAYYGQAQKVRTLMINEFNERYQDFDLLLSPTSPTTAFELDAKTADPMTMYVNDVCTIPSNLTGQPAMSVPFGVGDDGMPIGVQLLAPMLGEPTMMQAAAVLESAARAGEAK